MRILVVGAGIAGLTLTWWLRRDGHDVVLVEKSPRLRDEGYMLDFFGPGWEVAERMGLLPDLEAVHHPVDRLTLVAADGHEKLSLPYPRMRQRLFGGRHFNFMRGELEQVLHRRLDGDVRFGVRLCALEPQGAFVRAALSDGNSDLFDLVVGADGVHSATRALAFGEERRYARMLGHHAAAFLFDDAALVGELGNAFVTRTVPGRQVAVYPLRGGRVATLFVHRGTGARPPGSLEEQRHELRQVYGRDGWLVPRLLAAAERASSIYLDGVEQIEVPRWWAGRVVLVGDACGCVSLLAGQGASMAMAGAAALAAELSSGGELEAALARYQARVRPAVERRQRAGRRIARWFVPASGFAIAVRDLSMRLSMLPIASGLLRRQLASESATGHH
jgi:2-polyprenyl-6-methoxyphenol hydroxylase-like FAD-dependent oxidoreductase